MLILAGKSVATPFRSVSYEEDPRFRIGPTDRTTRKTTWVRNICLHTTQGVHPQPIRDGLGSGGSALANLKFWNRDTNYASAHLLVDRDGVVYQVADLVTEATYHATSVNDVSVGIEICQGSDGSLYDGELDVTVALVDWLTAQLGIQCQVPLAYTGHPLQRLVDGGKDFVGIYGHRDQTSGRGRGDPGDEIMERLVRAGYERFDVNKKQDLITWKARQIALGIPADGLPGKGTVVALKAKGKPAGLWVSR